MARAGDARCIRVIRRGQSLIFTLSFGYLPHVAHTGRFCTFQRFSQAGIVFGCHRLEAYVILGRPAAVRFPTLSGGPNSDGPFVPQDCRRKIMLAAALSNGKDSVNPMGLPRECPLEC